MTAVKESKWTQRSRVQGADGFGYSIQIDLHEALCGGSTVTDSEDIEQVSTPEEWTGLAPSFQELHRSNLDAAIAIVLVAGSSARKVWSLSTRRDLSGLGSIKGSFIISKPDWKSRRRKFANGERKLKCRSALWGKKNQW